MRRRRQKNPLLKRIITISVAIHIVALPILAHFNAFKSIQKSLAQVQMVVLTAPPDREMPKPEAKQKKVAVKSVAKKSSASAPRQNRGAIKIASNSPHVAVAQGGEGEGGDATVVQGAGQQGALPVNGAKVGGGESPSVQATVKPVPVGEPKPITPVEVKPVQPNVAPPKTVAAVPVATPPKEQVFTEAIAIGEQPALEIPDELRSEALDKTLITECIVSSEGVVKDVKVIQSTGLDALDRRGTQAARKWKFRPATRDGLPIESRVRLHIEFQVN